MVEIVLEPREIEQCNNKSYFSFIMNDICVFLGRKNFEIYKEIVPHLLAQFQNIFNIYEVIWAYEDFLSFIAKYYHSLFYIKLADIKSWLGQNVKERGSIAYLAANIGQLYFDRLCISEQNLSNIKETCLGYELFAVRF